MRIEQSWPPESAVNRKLHQNGNLLHNFCADAAKNPAYLLILDVQSVGHKALGYKMREQESVESPTATAPGIDRRQFPRIPLQEDVTFLWAGRRLTGTGRDVSGSGIFFLAALGRTPWEAALARGLVEGTRMRIFFRTLRATGECPCVNTLATVVRVDKIAEPSMVGIAAMFGHRET